MNKLQLLFASNATKVAMIHAEVDSAQDRLLAEAKQILSRSQEPAQITLIEHAKRLERLGFTATKVSKASEKERGRLIKEQLIDQEAIVKASLIQYYQQIYPFLKFLTEEELDKICDKWGLIYAPVASYIGDVPIKNLIEIENAQPLRTGPNSQTSTLDYRDDRPYNLETLKAVKFYSSTDPELKKELEKHFYVGAKIQRSGELWNRFIANCYGYEYDKVNRSGLFICAPSSEFNKEGLSKKGKGLFKVTLIKEDPIVFRYCKGGIQVLSKWGAEASDPALVLPINN